LGKPFSLLTPEDYTSAVEEKMFHVLGAVALDDTRKYKTAMAEIKDCLTETTEGFPAVSQASAWQCTCIRRAFRLRLVQKSDSNLLPLYPGTRVTKPRWLILNCAARLNGRP
jgi:hypothetical protein